MFELLLLLAGIAGLIIGTHLIINGALNIAEHYKLSRIFIGLTILAIGTDLPELVVVINGAIQRLAGLETSGLVVGETVGTSMVQIAFTLGMIGFLGTGLYLSKKEMNREGTALIASVSLFFLLALDGNLTRIDGIIMLISYAVYFLFLYKAEKKKERDIKRAPQLKKVWAILSLITGFVILIYCSNLVIVNAVLLSKNWNIAQSFIGAIVVGVGTSLPEIAVSIGALIKKQPRLLVGNLIGSNIFDVLVTLGIGSTISGFIVERNLLLFDIPFLLITSVVVIIVFISKDRLTKKESIILLVLYVIYFFAKLFSM